MSTKEGLLWDLTVKELRQLAKKNRVKLVKETLLGFGTYSVSSKDEIIEVLLESPRITKKKILAILEPSPKPKRIPKGRVSEKVTRERKITRDVQLTQILNEVKDFKKHNEYFVSSKLF